MARPLYFARLVCVLALAFAPFMLQAQTPVPPVPPVRRDTARADTVRADTTRRDTTRSPNDTLGVPTSRAATAAPKPRTARRGRAGAEAPIVRPPLSPRRAMLYSLALPGFGQTRLHRAATGAFFFFVEAGAVTMVTKSAFDLREARAYRSDSLLPRSYPVDTATGLPTTPSRVNGERNQFTDALVRARRLHLEDWFAVLAFNHLIAGAEAYVSANLWDLPTQITATPSRDGVRLAMSVAW
jgi:hypothetical protein